MHADYSNRSDYSDRYYSDRCPHCLYEAVTFPCVECGWQIGQDNDSPFLPLGTVLDGRYRIARVLGDGGFGVTYLSWEENLQFRLAIKEYFYRDASTRATDRINITVYSEPLQEVFYHGLDRFLQEARLLARFDHHPSIVSVKGFFRANGTGYMVMEYMEGLTMRQYLDKCPEQRTPFDRALTLLAPIIGALQSIHKEEILHRDISPDNVYLTKDGHVKLLDFGAARFYVGEEAKSLSVLLKHGYAPEEQYRSSSKQGPWTDIYALAATFYRAITGVVPLNALDRLNHDDLAPPSLYEVDLSPKHESALLKALSVKAEDRFQSIEAFQQALYGITTPEYSANIAPDIISLIQEERQVLAKDTVSTAINLGKSKNKPRSELIPHSEKKTPEVHQPTKPQPKAARITQKEAVSRSPPDTNPTPALLPVNIAAFHPDFKHAANSECYLPVAPFSPPQQLAVEPEPSNQPKITVAETPKGNAAILVLGTLLVVFNIAAVAVNIGSMWYFANSHTMATPVQISNLSAAPTKLIKPASTSTEIVTIKPAPITATVTPPAPVVATAVTPPAPVAAAVVIPPAPVVATAVTPPAPVAAAVVIPPAPVVATAVTPPAPVAAAVVIPPAPVVATAVTPPAPVAAAVVIPPAPVIATAVTPPAPVVITPLPIISSNVASATAINMNTTTQPAPFSNTMMVPVRAVVNPPPAVLVKSTSNLFTPSKVESVATPVAAAPVAVAIPTPPKVESVATPVAVAPVAVAIPTPSKVESVAVPVAAAPVAVAIPTPPKVESVATPVAAAPVAVAIPTPSKVESVATPVAATPVAVAIPTPSKVESVATPVAATPVAVAIPTPPKVESVATPVAAAPVAVAIPTPSKVESVATPVAATPVAVAIPTPPKVESVATPVAATPVAVAIPTPSKVESVATPVAATPVAVVIPTPSKVESVATPVAATPVAVAIPTPSKVESVATPVAAAPVAVAILTPPKVESVATPVAATPVTVAIPTPPKVESVATPVAAAPVAVAIPTPPKVESVATPVAATPVAVAIPTPPKVESVATPVAATPVAVAIPTPSKVESVATPVAAAPVAVAIPTPPKVESVATPVAAAPVAVAIPTPSKVESVATPVAAAPVAVAIPTPPKVESVPIPLTSIQIPTKATVPAMLSVVAVPPTTPILATPQSTAVKQPLPTFLEDGKGFGSKANGIVTSFSEEESSDHEANTAERNLEHFNNQFKQELYGIIAYKKPVRVGSLMTKRERAEYRYAMQTARTLGVRRQIRELIYARLSQRAREQGMLVAIPNSAAYAAQGEMVPQAHELGEQGNMYSDPAIQDLRWTFAYKKPVRVDSLMTKRERNAYRYAMQTARTVDAQQRIRELTYARLGQRAMERGMFVVVTNRMPSMTHGEFIPQVHGFNGSIAPAAHSLSLPSHPKYSTKILIS